MAIDAVSPSISANVQTTQTARAQTPPDQAVEARKAAEDRAKAQAQLPAEAPKPVVNTQGQTTGKIINVTA